MRGWTHGHHHIVQPEKLSISDIAVVRGTAFRRVYKERRASRCRMCIDSSKLIIADPESVRLELLLRSVQNAT